MFHSHILRFKNRQPTYLADGFFVASPKFGRQILNNNMEPINLELDQQQRNELEQSAKKQGVTPEQFLLSLFRMWQEYEWEQDA